MIEGLDLSPANNVLGVVGGEQDQQQQEQRADAHKQPHMDKSQAVGAKEDDDDDVWGDGGSNGDDEGGSAGGGARQQLPVLPYSAWQAGGGYVELSQRAELLRLDLSGHLGDAEGAAVLELAAPPSTATGTAAGTAACHAIVLWLEYDMVDQGEGKGQQVAVSTGPRADGGPCPTVQGVYLLQQPVAVGPVGQGGAGGAGTGAGRVRLHVSVSFDGLDGDVEVEVTQLPPGAGGDGA